MNPIRFERKDPTQPFAEQINAVSLDNWNEIYGWLTTPRERVSFHRVNRFFWTQSKTCPEWSTSRLSPPTYLDRDLTIRALSIDQKRNSAMNMEQLFLSKERFPIVYQSVISQSENQVPTPKIIFGNYLIYATGEGKSSIYVRDLVTKVEKTVSAHEAEIAGFAGIQADSPLLYSDSSSDGFKIWNLQSMLPLGSSEKRTISHAYKADRHFLAVAVEKSVVVKDCRAKGGRTVIEFANAMQIEFTSTHLLLVSESEIAMWPLEDFFNSNTNVTLESASFHYVRAPSRIEKNNRLTVEIAKIKFAKIHGDKLFIAYTSAKIEPDPKTPSLPLFYLGEIWDWQKKAFFKWVEVDQSYSHGFAFNADAIDFLNDKMVASVRNLNLWNLSPTLGGVISGTSLVDRVKLKKVYFLGRYILSTTEDGILLTKRYDVMDYRSFTEKKLQKQQFTTRRDPWMISDKEESKEEEIAAKLISFDLVGRYLMTEVESESKRTLTVYQI